MKCCGSGQVRLSRKVLTTASQAALAGASSTHCSGSEVLTWNLVQSSGTPILVLHSIGKQDMLVAKCAKSGFLRKCHFNILHLKSQDF